MTTVFPASWLCVTDLEAVDDATIMFSTFWPHVTVPVTGGDVTVMLPACVTVPATGGDVTKVLLAFWLWVTVPASGEDM